MLDALTSIASETTSLERRRVLMRQAEMLLQSAEDSVRAANDLEDVQLRYRRLMAVDASAEAAERLRQNANGR